MSRTIPSSQYETNLWSTHVNIVRLAEPIRRCVRWRTQVFKIEGFVCKRFLHSLPPPPPPPPPTFIFLALVSFLARPKPRIPFLGLSLLRNQTETLLLCIENFVTGSSLSLIKNKAQTAVINIVSFRIFINLMFRMPSTYIFKSDLNTFSKVFLKIYFLNTFQKWLVGFFSWPRFSKQPSVKVY